MVNRQLITVIFEISWHYQGPNKNKKHRRFPHAVNGKPIIIKV